jgi:hypothetical protein
MTGHSHVSAVQAIRVGQHIGIDWVSASLHAKQFRTGMESNSSTARGTRRPT